MSEKKGEFFMATFFPYIKAMELLYFKFIDFEHEKNIDRMLNAREPIDRCCLWQIELHFLSI